MCVCVCFIQLSVGAGESLGPQNFHGCLENLLYNGHSLIELAKEKSQRVAVAVSQSLIRDQWGRTSAERCSVAHTRTPEAARCNTISNIQFSLFFLVPLR